MSSRLSAQHCLLYSASSLHLTAHAAGTSSSLCSCSPAQLPACLQLHCLSSRHAAFCHPARQQQLDHSSLSAGTDSIEVCKVCKV